MTKKRKKQKLLFLNDSGNKQQTITKIHKRSTNSKKVLLRSLWRHRRWRRTHKASMLWSINTENHTWYQSANILHSRRIDHNRCFIDQFELRSFSSAGIIMNNSSLCAWFTFMNNNDPSYWLMSQTHKAIKDKHPSPVGASLAARKRQRDRSFFCFSKYPWKIHRQSRSSLWGHKPTPVLFLNETLTLNLISK